MTLVLAPDVVSDVAEERHFKLNQTELTIEVPIDWLIVQNLVHGKPFCCDLIPAEASTAARTGRV